MVYLASACGGVSCSRSRGGTSPAGDPEATPCKSHREAFAEWLGLSRARQAADLRLYLHGLAIERDSVLRVWFDLGPYRNLVPVSASSVEQELFISGLTELIETMIRDSTGTFRDERGYLPEEPNPPAPRLVEFNSPSFHSTRS
jgi:hypothetical protein